MNVSVPGNWQAALDSSALSYFRPRSGPKPAPGDWGIAEAITCLRR